MPDEHSVSKPKPWREMVWPLEKKTFRCFSLVFQVNTACDWIQ